MALRKGFCTHCHGEEKERIFDVNREAEICYCPRCLSPMLPKEAINNYGTLISHYLKKASKYIFETTEYLKAYQTFAYIIDLNDSIKVAHFGRLLSMVYLSTLRTSKISFAYQLHKQEALRLFHYQENANEYFHFLWLLLDALDEYENRMKKRLMAHGNTFYDIDCIIMYLRRMEEIRLYKEFIADEANFFIESNKDQYKDILKRVKETAKNYEKAFASKYITADGYSYAFFQFAHDGTPLITLQSQAPLKNMRKIKPIYLTPKDNKKSHIRDDIYLNNLPLSRLVSASIPLAIILMIAAVAGGVMSLFVDDQFYKILIYIGAGLVLLLSLILFILHFAWKGRLRKKYYNGTNPFIFK